jgi:hypothetical protein
MADAFFEFVSLVKKNLGKNGFPANAVSFSLDRMYEEAEKRGFSFNKVRDVFRTEGVDSVLEGDKVVFRMATPPGMSENDFSEMSTLAKNMLERMSPEERSKLMDAVKNMDPAAMESARQQWETMSPEEKRRAMESMKR